MYFQVPRDEAENRRKLLERVDWIMWTILGAIEFMLVLRLVINLFVKNPVSWFSSFVYGITGVIIAPFGTLLGMPTFVGSVFEMTTLAAMAAYVMIFWLIISMNGALMARVAQGPEAADDMDIESTVDQIPVAVLK